jgi:hypothetical protein
MAVEIDYFEYANDTDARLTYVTNATIASFYPTQDADHVKATTNRGNNYLPYFTTDPTKSLIGDTDAAPLGWEKEGPTGTYTNRFHIDLGSAKIITRIYYENFHNTGAYTAAGVKNFTFWGSNSATAFAELTYGTDTNWTQLTTSQSTFDQHVDLNQADPKYITVTNITAYRYYAVKIADSWGTSGYMGIRRIELQQTDFQSYSSTTKTQGSYSLKVEAAQTDSLNKTLTHTFDPPLDLSGVNTAKIDMQATRTGANVKLGLHDTGGTTTEFTPTINTADEFETKTLDLSDVADADKNAIDTFTITPVNADAVNTIYFDNFIATTIYSSIGDLSINLTPTSIINKIISILGNLSIVLTPNSLYELINQVFEIIGNLNINLIPNSIVSGNYSRDGSLNINLLPTSIINKSLTIPSNLLVEFIVHSIINKSVIKTSNLQINLVPNASYVRSYDRNGNLIIELIPNATGNISYGRLGDLLINLSPEAMVKFKHTTLRNNDFFLFFS